MQKHEQQCRYKPKPCPDCGEMIAPDKMEKHRSEECQFRKDQCEYCGKKLSHYKIQVRFLSRPSSVIEFARSNLALLFFFSYPFLYRSITRRAKSILYDASIARMKCPERMYVSFFQPSHCVLLSERVELNVSLLCIQMKHHVDEECRHVKCSCGEVVSHPSIF